MEGEHFLHVRYPSKAESETPTCDSHGAFPLQPCNGRLRYPLFDSAKLSGMWDIVVCLGFVKWRMEGSFYGTRPREENSFPWGINMTKTLKDLMR